MVGEDAVSVYTQLLMKFVDLLVKIGEEKRRNKQQKAPKKPKIRQGSLSKKDLSKLVNKGADFGFIQIPKEHEADVERMAADMGASFFKVDDNENRNILYPYLINQYLVSQKNQSFQHCHCPALYRCKVRRRCNTPSP